MNRRGALLDRLRRAFLLALAGLLLSCGPNESDSESRPPPAAAALEVEYAGCWAVYLPGPVCALWEGATPKLKLWVKADPRSKVEIRADGQRLETAGEEVSGGRRYLLSIPRAASRLTVSAVSPEGGHGASWSLRLAEPDMPAWLSEIKGLTSRGETGTARRRLRQLQQSAPREEQGFVLRSLSYLARAEGNHEEEARFLRQGWSADRAEERWSGEVEKATRLAGLYLDEGRFGEVRKILAALRLPPRAPADAKCLLAYHHGLLSDAVGDYRTALEQLRKAEGLAECVGMAGYRWNAAQVLARVYQDLGRSQEASELFTSLRANPYPTNRCGLGTLLTNLGWTRLLAREAGQDIGDPTPTLEEARAEFDQHRCLPGERLNARLNLALAYQQARRWPEARRALREARTLGAIPNLRQRLWWADLEAWMAIAEGRPERALGRYEELEGMAERALSSEGRLRSLLGQAHARLALGQPTEAITALAEADRLIDAQSWRIPAHEGRDTFIAQREAITRLYLELLLAEGQRESAFALARRARSRLLRQLTVTDRLTQLTPAEQRRWDEALSAYWTSRNAVDRQAAEEWQPARDEVQRAREAQAAQLAAAQDALDRALTFLGDPGKLEDSSLSPPAPGEVILAYHPMGDGWVGFASTERTIDVATFDLADGMPADPDRLAALLLAPFSRAIRGAERVRVLPYGRLRSVDFHALPFEGEPLLARHVVVYSLDLPVRASLVPPGPPRVLLVSNPQNDLPATRGESATIATRVRAWGSGWSCERLDGPQARAEAVRAALPTAGLFHYAGHGVFAGFAGWGSALPLADGSRLTLGDVLALPRAPAWVVLSACDAGRSSEQAPVEGVGLANAFLLAGSQAVIAARQPVDDRSARDLMRELYRGWQPGRDLARQLQRAQLAERRKNPSASAAWTSFRLLVP
jgi:tetratricopeptide (TPR) repeat protein